MPSRRVVVRQFGSPAVLELEERAPSEPRPREVSIRVRASGVAFGDVLKRRAPIMGRPRLPFHPGYDVAGEVNAVGAEVTSLRVGDRVAAFVGEGGNSDHVCVDARAAVVLPASVDFAAAVSVVLNYVTARQLLRLARLEAGQTLLVHGAAGGVGVAVLELARILGVRSYGTASSSKHAKVEALGGYPIDYRSQDFASVLAEHAPEGIHAVFDPIGGEHLRRSRSVLRADGHLVCFGASAPRAHSWRARQTLLRIAWYKMIPGPSAHFYGIGMPPASSLERIREDLAALLQMLASGELAPIHTTLRLEQVRSAHERLEAAEVIGKLVLLHD